ncbi:MAG: 16S rRNA (uracil(1498)-N(3))-methyltransferase [Polyangiaceae bacterium]
MIKRRAPIAKLASGELTLDAAAGRYLGRVLRLAAGDDFIAFEPDHALEADAKIIAIDDGMVTVRIGDIRNAQVVADRNVTLVQGIAKGEKCDAIVRDATELGATKIIFASTERSVVRLDATRSAERLTRWKKIAEEAARQCGRGDAPAISIAAWNDAIQEARAADVRFVLDPHAHVPLAPHLLEAARERVRGVAFAVGAEGGLTPDEIKTAEKQGWRAVSFGNTVLRTETMTSAFLGALRAFAQAFEDPSES